MEDDIKGLDRLRGDVGFKLQVAKVARLMGADFVRDTDTTDSSAVVFLYKGTYMGELKPNALSVLNASILTPAEEQPIALDDLMPQEDAPERDDPLFEGPDVDEVGRAYGSLVVQIASHADGLGMAADVLDDTGNSVTAKAMYKVQRRLHLLVEEAEQVADELRITYPRM